MNINKKIVSIEGFKKGEENKEEEKNRRSKKLASSSLGEFEITVKNAMHINPQRKNEIIANFLKVNIDEVFSTKQMYPMFKMPVVCYSLSEMLRKDKDIVIEYLTFYEKDGYKGEVSRMQVEIDVDKTTDVITLGDYFLTAQGKKFVVAIDFARNCNVGFVSIYAADKNEKEASQFIADLDNLIKKSNFLKGKKITPFGKFLKLKKSYTWEDVIFSEELKNEIKQNIEKYLANLELYRKNGLPTKRGILFLGVPGIGKTLLGKVLASTIEDVTFIWVTPKYFNESRDYCIDILFDLANELAPTILFMEDVDFYGVSRKYGNNSTVLGEFLNKVDGIVENEGVLIIMTTNHPEMLDPAIKERPGRFDRLIEILPPKERERYKMLKHFCKDLKTRDIDWENLTYLSEGFTGALIKELIITASSFAIEDKSLDDNDKVILKQKHFDQSFETLKKYSKVKEKSISGFRKCKEEDTREPCDEVCISNKTQYEKDSGDID